MKTFDTYGAKGVNLEQARAILEAALAIQMEGRESSYLGGDYYSYKYSPEESLTLQINYDVVGDEWAKERFKEASVLLSISRTQRPEYFEEALKKVPIFTHLERQEL